MLKHDPSSRKICTIGPNRKDVALFELINDDLMLVKFNENDGKNMTNYWTMLNTNGQIKEIPKEMNDILNSMNWTSLMVKRIEEPQSTSYFAKEDFLTGYRIVLSCYKKPEVLLKSNLSY